MNNKDKRLREYMNLPYTVMLRRDEEGDFIARIKEFEGCIADGQDEMEALGNLEVVKELWIETALKAGQPVPKPDADEELPSGKFLTRVPRSLHKRLVDIAQHEGVSLNQLVTVTLAELAGRKAAVALDLSDMTASAPSCHFTGPYGASQGVSRLRLVNADRSRVSDPETSGLLWERTIADVLSMQSGPSLRAKPTRKEA